MTVSVAVSVTVAVTVWVSVAVTVTVTLGTEDGVRLAVESGVLLLPPSEPPPRVEVLVDGMGSMSGGSYVGGSKVSMPPDPPEPPLEEK